MSQAQDSVDNKGDFLAVISLFRYGRGVYPRLFFSIGLVVLSSFFLMLSAKNMGHLAEILLTRPNSDAEIYRTVVWILLLEALNIFVTYRGRVGLSYATNQVAFSIRQALFRKLTKLPIAYYDQQPLGRTITRLTADVEGVESFFGNTLPRVLTAFITVISVILAMLFTDPKVGLWIAASSVPAIVFTVMTRKPVRFWTHEYKRKSAGLNAKLAEFINGLSVIRIFGLEKWSATSFHGSSDELMRTAFSMMNWNSLIRPISAFLCSMPLVLIIWWGGHLTLDGAMSVGLLVAFIRYAERYFRPVMQLSFELHLIQDAIASSDRVRKMLEEPEEESLLGPSGTERKALVGEVEYRDVWMGYTTGTPILKGVSFHAQAGESIGLVGKTGSGKSSTLHLIPQLYPIQSGDIIIDGVSIKDWDRQALREQIGVVSQDVVIFYGTLRDNLLVTTADRDAVSEADLRAACGRTGLLHLVEKLPQGFSTLIYDGGTNLSMGERQLVALTRMLLRNPSILILDEATANVDEPCEALIQKAISELLKGRTCFIIAHRLSTIRHCDRILVFDHGTITEAGRHESLLEQNGHYAQLVKRQIANAYI